MWLQYHQLVPTVHPRLNSGDFGRIITQSEAGKNYIMAGGVAGWIPRALGEGPLSENQDQRRRKLLVRFSTLAPECHSYTHLIHPILLHRRPRITSSLSIST